MTGLPTLALCLLAAGSSPADLQPSGHGCATASRHYVLLFGGQTNRYRPRTAHTWATFVKAAPQADGTVAVETMTISWLPVRMPVRPLRLFPETGRNYGLHETLELFDTANREIGLWGPYEIRESWYHEAVAHKRLLDSGAVTFKTLDRGPLLRGAPVRHPDISHCVHAVTRTNERLMEASTPVLGYGEFVTRKVADRMAAGGLLIEPATTHDWLLAALRIEHVPLTRRRIGEPVLKLLR